MSKKRKALSALFTVFKTLSKIVAVLLLTVLVILVGALGVFFATPRFAFNGDQLRSFSEKYLPASMAIKFTDADLEILREKGLPFAKTISLRLQNFCYLTNDSAIEACFKDIRLSVSGGWGGERNDNENRILPHVIRISPLIILGGNIRVDTYEMEKKEEEKTESSLDIVNLLRTHVLPKWDIEGSRVEIETFLLRSEPSKGFEARAFIVPGNAGETLRLTLERFRSLDDSLSVKGLIQLTRPAGWLNPKTQANDIDANRWKVFADADVKAGAKRIKLNADSNITSFSDLDFRIRALLKGVPVLKEARLEGALKGPEATGRFSVKAASIGTQIQTLDFMNCDWGAHLENKTAKIRCGPQTVRLAMREKPLFRRPKLFVLSPVFDLQVRRVTFGEVKSADFEFELDLDHEGSTLVTDLAGSFRKDDSKLEYAVRGDGGLSLKSFQFLVEVLRDTPVAMPAPLNVLDGRLTTDFNVDLTEGGGTIDFDATTRLSSQYQSVNLDIKGSSRLFEGPKGLIPDTSIDLAINELRLSLPRFDLRAPPPFKPDSRFGSLANAKSPPKKEAEGNGNFKLRIHTSSSEAIRLASNMTKAPVPISIDVTYDTRNADIPRAQDGGEYGASNPDLRTMARQELAPEVRKKAARAPVTGWVVVGRTPIELFRRQAVMEEIRVDLLESGLNRLYGRASVNYLEYSIIMLLAGDVSDPQVRFVSDPPLDDDQILSVLLFGRPKDELDEDEASSVGSMNAALTDTVLGLSSLYFLASTPIESVGYDPETKMMSARVGLGGGTALVLGAGNRQGGAGVGIRKRLTREFIFRSDVETVGRTGKRTVSALIEWVKKF